MAAQLSILVLTAFFVGIAVGYGIRSVISSRRRARARRRFIDMGT
jgi:hypothetical protein